MDYDIAVFDCDGVLLDSNKIKSAAFRKVLEEEEESLVDDFIDYHQENGGVSRYKKFEHFYYEMKKQSDRALVDEALERYASIVSKELVECDMIEGVKDYLESLKEHNIPCYVNTGSDEEELKTVFKKRGLSGYFYGILGSPTNKYDNMERIDGISSKKILYFGDAKMDYLVSTRYNADFIFVSGVSEWQEGLKEMKDKKQKIIKDFNELPGVIND